MTVRKTLIVGFGNVLLGDDGFGVEVVTRLGASALPAHVQVMDVGIGGLHCVLRLMEGFEAVIVVDAVRRGGPPGTLYLFPPGIADLDAHGAEAIDPHGAEPVQALTLAKALGHLPAAAMVVGCEPASCRPGAPLSMAVRAAVERAVQTIRHMVIGAVHDAFGAA